MLVKEIMTPSVSCVCPEASLEQVAKQMKQENIGAVPVCSDSGRVLGIITDRDIVLRAVAINNSTLKAEDIMSTNITYASPTMNTHDAALLFSRHQVRRLPVVSNNKLVGIISLADIARKTLFIDEAGDALSAISKPNGLS